MQIQPLANANASVITVTSTATRLLDLLDTAASAANNLPSYLNAVRLYVEDGDVRLLDDGNTPTASKGLLLKSGGMYHFTGINLANIRLIRAGSTNVTVDVAVGRVTDDEGASASFGGNSGTGASASQVQGNVAAGATDSGNPVKTGGVYNSSAPTYTNGQRGDTQLDVNGNTKVREQYAPGYEDNNNNVAKVEQRFSSSGVLTTDIAVKSAAGFVHTITFSPNDATPTAGSIIVYDNTAESGTQLFNWSVAATAFIPFTITLDQTFATGLYVGFTTTNDVNVSVSYR